MQGSALTIYVHVWSTDALPDPNLHWSLSELDSGNTRGAIESWGCSGLVDQVTPIKGDLIGHVDGWAEKYLL